MNMISFKDYLTLNEGAMSSGDIYPFEIKYSNYSYDSDPTDPNNAMAWFSLESGNKIVVNMNVTDYFNSDNLIKIGKLCSYLAFEIYGEDDNRIRSKAYAPTNLFETPHKIFRTVLDFVQKYIQEQNPIVVAFGSETQKRHRLYKRMANIIMQDHQDVVMRERMRKVPDAPEGSMYYVYIGKEEVFED